MRSSSWCVGLQRKRKKDQDDSSISSHSIFSASEEEDDGPSKRKKRLGKMASLANLFASGTGDTLHNAKKALKKSISGMLNPAGQKEASTPSQENGHSPTPSVTSIPSSPALLRTRGSIVSLSRLSVSLIDPTFGLALHLPSILCYGRDPQI